jgi:uncharacterized protein (TIGR01619 family)
VNWRWGNAKKDEWDFYFSNVNHVLSSFMVNLSAIRRAPDTAKPWLLWIWVHMLHARADGLSSESEAPLLYKIEDRLNECLQEPCGAELLGRITGDSRREFYYYAKTSDGLDRAVKSALSDFSDYRGEWGKQQDPDWHQYRDLLYPSASQMRVIQDRRVLDQLQQRGDDHAIARVVDHAIYFRTAGERTAFSSMAVRLGFAIQHESEDAKSRERRFFLNVTRRDPVTLDHISAVVAELVELAERFGGDYDGWGCEVQKSPSI